MNKLTQLIILIFILAISFWGCFVFFAQADIKDIAGFAWSENTGWLSFNSSNCDSDGDGITDTGN